MTVCSGREDRMEKTKEGCDVLMMAYRNKTNEV